MTNFLALLSRPHAYAPVASPVAAPAPTPIDASTPILVVATAMVAALAIATTLPLLISLLGNWGWMVFCVAICLVFIFLILLV